MIVILESFQLTLLLGQSDFKGFLLSAQGTLIHIIVGIKIHGQEIFIEDDLKMKLLLLYTLQSHGGDLSA